MSRIEHETSLPAYARSMRALACLLAPENSGGKTLFSSFSLSSSSPPLSSIAAAVAVGGHVCARTVGVYGRYRPVTRSPTTLENAAAPHSSARRRTLGGAPPTVFRWCLLHHRRRSAAASPHLRRDVVARSPLFAFLHYGREASVPRR